MPILALMCVLLALAWHAPALLAQTPPVVELEGVRSFPPTPIDPDHPSAQLIVLRFKKHDIMNPTPITPAQLARVSQAAGVPLKFERLGGGDVQVLRLPRKMRPAEAEAIANRIAKLPEIEHAGYDRLFGHYAARSGPNEPNDLPPLR